MRKLSIIALSGFAVLFCVRLAAQSTRPVPGPASDTMPVSGTVSIGNIPTIVLGNVPDVRIANMPSVSVANIPTVSVAPAGFMKPGRYLITWSSGESETVAVSQVHEGGWLRTERNGRDRWINTAAARSIEEAR